MGESSPQISSTGDLELVSGVDGCSSSWVDWLSFAHWTLPSALTTAYRPTEHQLTLLGREAWISVVFAKCSWLLLMSSKEQASLLQTVALKLTTQEKTKVPFNSNHSTKLRVSWSAGEHGNSDLTFPEGTVTVGIWDR